jgi:tagaturonate reductase
MRSSTSLQGLLPLLHARNQEKYPEKILQFGTGVLLKGLPDFLLQKAREAGVFSGSVVLVKSTGRTGQTPGEGQYLMYEHGIKEGRDHEEWHLVDMISRELHAGSQWDQVLELACSPDLEIVLSNTTEAGLVYVKEDFLHQIPGSFPARLTALLYARFKAGLQGLVVIPCELVPDNGKILRQFVLQHCGDQNLGLEFETWLEEQVFFCNSLVDRIVSGAMTEEKHQALEAEAGQQLPPVIETEPYLLWAIECPAQIRSRLGWMGVHPNWILSDDISVYRERKLRILNGTHTMMVAYGFLKGFETVLECMRDPEFSAFTEGMVFEEIVPATPVDEQVALSFASDVLDRFRNPQIRHELLNICFQYTMKMAMRNLPTIERYESRFGYPPQKMATGFAAYLHFLNPHPDEKGGWMGKFRGKTFEIQDEKAQVFSRLRNQPGFPHSVFSSKELWADFVFSDGFKKAVVAEFDRLKLELEL